MLAIKESVAYAAQKFDADFETDLVYWEEESGPAYGDLTCKLSWISDRQESFRDFDSGASDAIELEQSSLVLATVQLTFESIQTTTTDYATARTFAARVRQYLSSKLFNLYVRTEKGLVVLSTNGPITPRRKTVDGRLINHLSFETKWRFEFGMADRAETQDLIDEVKFEGEIADYIEPPLEVEFTTE